MTAHTRGSSVNTSDDGASPADFTGEARSLVAKMTLAEKASLCSGGDFWRLKTIERLGIGRIAVSDGPHGLRKQLEGQDHLGLGQSVPATCFPAGVSMASSWDPALCREMAECLAHECRAQKVSVVLGPAMNIKRNPLCGRNFEYYSEDPYLAGELAAAFIDGAQSVGVGTSPKHFAANNQEYGRMCVDTLVDERTLRELYLPAFEAAITRSQPWTIMSAYNQLNGDYCSENPWLLQQVLRKEWGFQGLVVSDWGGTNDRVAGVAAGHDLEMPSSCCINDRKIEKAVTAGALSEAALDAVVIRVVCLILASTRRLPPEESGGPGRSGDAAAAADGGAELLRRNHAFALRAAEQCAVLLKNERPTVPPRSPCVLPLSPTSLPNGLAVIGTFATAPRYQGAGSSRINAHRVDAPLDAIRSYLKMASLSWSPGSTAPSITYVPGYEPASCLMSSPPTIDEEAMASAVAAASTASASVVFVGLPSSYEAEGVDRKHMRIPLQMSQLLSAVGAVCPRTVVVIMGGAPMELPTLDAVPAALYVGLCGQGVGGAVARLLFGAACPSGKLAETWPHQLADCPSQANFATDPTRVVYREALNVGYRYFTTAKVPTRFPFGHGLSYATFKYGKASLSATSLSQADLASSGLQVTMEVKNEGSVFASEVVQLYVRDRVASVHRPDRELKAFTKVHDLAPNAKTKVTLTLGSRAFAFYDLAPATKGGDGDGDGTPATQTATGGGGGQWYVEPGEFELLVGSSCEDIREMVTVRVTKSAGAEPYSYGARGPSQGYVTLDDHGLSQLGLHVPTETSLSRALNKNSTFEEIRRKSYAGWLLVSMMVQGAKREAANGGASGFGDEEAAMLIVMAGLLGSSLRSLQLMLAMVHQGWVSDTVIDVTVHVLNGRYLSAMARCLGFRAAAVVVAMAAAAAATVAVGYTNPVHVSRDANSLWAPWHR